MIDTDKYEGHSVGKWRVRTRKGTFTVKDCLGDEVAAVNDYADAQLIADAPLLLEKLKRLHSGMQDILDDFETTKTDMWSIIKRIQELIE
jgi:hypothetical protein